MKILPLGDSSLIIRLRETLDHPRDILAAISNSIEILRRAALPGVLEITPAFTSIGVFFDPAEVAKSSGEEMPNEWLSAQIKARLRPKKIAVKKFQGRLVEIPVCYEKEFAPDMELVAERTGLTKEEIVRLHSTAEYLVHCLGFTPGFAYLSGLAKKLAVPRRATPRKQVPAGAVAIGGGQTGVYPQDSPGGWNIIGRSPIRFFDAHSSSPTFLRAGDRIRFRSITRAQFDSLGK